MYDEENVWVVAFIDPECGYCRKLAYQWERVRISKTVRTRRVKLGYVDVTYEESKYIVSQYCAGYRIEYTPTIFLYGRDKYAPVVYDGDYSAKDIAVFVGGYCD